MLTFVRLPRAWWPAEWYDETGRPRFVDPVVELLRALYGHPLAGDIWHDNSALVLKNEKFKKVEGWPSVFVRTEGTESTVIVLYVDDLLMFGGKTLRDTIAKIREVIVMEEPAGMTRYLGCGHDFTVQGPAGDRTKKCVCVCVCIA